MPLSEDEQRILSEIEAQLLASDPDLAKSVGSSRGSSDGMRRVQLGVVGLIVGLVATVLLLSVNYVLSFVVGFGLMFVSALAVERGARQVRADGTTRQRPRSVDFGIRDYFSDAPQRARDAIRRDEDD